MLGSGLNRLSTTSPPSASAGSRSRTNPRTSGSRSATWRGVNPRATSVRNAVCAGGSCITSGGSASPMASISPYAVVRPCAEENVWVSTAAARMSACRDST